MKVHFRPLCFYETSTLVPVYTNQNKSKKDFHFYKKKKKWKEKQYWVFALQEPIWREHTPWDQWEWSKLLSRIYT